MPGWCISLLVCYGLRCETLIHSSSLHLLLWWVLRKQVGNNSRLKTKTQHKHYQHVITYADRTYDLRQYNSILTLWIHTIALLVLLAQQKSVGKHYTNIIQTFLVILTSLINRNGYNCKLSKLKIIKISTIFDDIWHLLYQPCMTLVVNCRHSLSPIVVVNCYCQLLLRTIVVRAVIKCCQIVILLHWFAAAARLLQDRTKWTLRGNLAPLVHVRFVTMWIAKYLQHNWN